MQKVLLVAALFAVAANAVLATPIIGRGAGTLKPKQFIAQLDLAYSQTAKTYNWTDKKWDTLAAKKKTTTISGMLLLGYAPLKKWEILAMVPLASKSQDTLSSMGVGDVELHTRYQFIADKKAPVKLTAAAAFGLPTSNKDAKPKIGDGKMSGGLGLIATTKSFGKIVGHLRAAYWLNGKVNDTTKVGNMFEYVTKLDYDFTKSFQLWLSLVGTMQAKTEVNGTAVDKTQQDRHVTQVGAVVKPVPVLSIRPKVMVPIAALCKGGAIAPFGVGLDFWVIAPEKK
ncbi:MAG: hypothetical protein ABIL25_02050 [candidate division WOR-3 bacterium]